MDQKQSRITNVMKPMCSVGISNDNVTKALGALSTTCKELRNMKLVPNAKITEQLLKKTHISNTSSSKKLLIQYLFKLDGGKTVLSIHKAVDGKLWLALGMIEVSNLFGVEIHEFQPYDPAYDEDDDEDVDSVTVPRPKFPIKITDNLTDLVDYLCTAQKALGIKDNVSITPLVWFSINSSYASDGLEYEKYRIQNVSIHKLKNEVNDDNRHIIDGIDKLCILIERILKVNCKEGGRRSVS